MEGRSKALVAGAAINPEPGAYRGANNAPPLLDLFSEVPFPSLGKSKLSRKRKADKLVTAKFLWVLTRLLQGRTSSINSAARGGFS